MIFNKPAGAYHIKITFNSSDSSECIKKIYKKDIVIPKSVTIPIEKYEYDYSYDENYDIGSGDDAGDGWY